MHYYDSLVSPDKKGEVAGSLVPPAPLPVQPIEDEAIIAAAPPAPVVHEVVLTDHVEVQD